MALVVFVRRCASLDLRLYYEAHFRFHEVHCDMAGPVIRRIKQGSPKVRLFISDGSERSDYMPQRQALKLLGAPHSGVNLMSCYYPRQTFWPERRLFGPDVPHYRHSPKDGTEGTRLKDLNEWTDGYYSFEIDDPDTGVLEQVADVRRYGQEPRLTVTADLDTTDAELERMASVLRPFGRMQLRLNHEANGCTWFRFARNVGEVQGEAQQKLYYDISQFFIRAHHVFRDIAPNVTFVACYNGPGERAARGEIAPGELPCMSLRELGLMYLVPGIVCSLDQYGSLHYGWPGHTISDPPIIGNVTHAEHVAFALTPTTLCNGVVTLFWRAMCQMRGDQVRVDLGELNFDENIHGPQIQAHLVHEAYDWIRQHPEIVGSVTFYELTDMGGLGLFRQRRYGDLDDLKTTILADVYKRIMQWEEFRHPCVQLDPLLRGAKSAALVWRSSVDAEGLELALEGREARQVDFREKYWRRVFVAAADGSETCIHSSAQKLRLRRGTESIKLFALPPDGRDNSPDGFRATVPVPVLTG